MRTGPDAAFIGGLNSDRTADINGRIGADWADSDVTVPALFLCGAEDPVLRLINPRWREKMTARVPDLRRFTLIEGAGHFVQQENPARTNAALLAFLKELQSS